METQKSAVGSLYNGLSGGSNPAPSWFFVCRRDKCPDTSTGGTSGLPSHQPCLPGKKEKRKLFMRTEACPRGTPMLFRATHILQRWVCFPVHQQAARKKIKKRGHYYVLCPSHSVIENVVALLGVYTCCDARETTRKKPLSKMQQRPVPGTPACRGDALCV